MRISVDLLQELPAEESVGRGGAGVNGCCALGSITTCPGCTFTL
jgi:hypothetical protein